MQRPIAEHNTNRHNQFMPELVIRRGLAEPDTSANYVPHKPQRPEKSDGGKAFRIQSEYQPAGDQPTAIADLVAGIAADDRTQVLLGVTGSGKTFTMAQVIETLQRPALILAPNKILAAPAVWRVQELLPRQRSRVFRQLL